MNILEKAHKKHKTWLSICRSFGLDKETAEDITQEMYIKLHEITEKGTDISYGKDELNYYYIFKILYTMFLQLKKKKDRVHFVDEEHVKNIQANNTAEFKQMEEKFNKEFNKLEKKYLN